MVSARLPLYLISALVLASCAVGGDSTQSQSGALDDSVEQIELKGPELARELIDSPVRDAPIPFRRLGVRWTGAAPDGFEISFSTDGSTWSRWRPIEIHHTEVQDQVSYVGAVELPEDETATFYRLRATRSEQPSFIELSFFARSLGEIMEIGEAPGIASMSQSLGLRSIGSVQVLPRSAWGAKPANCSGRAHSPSRVTIHHTDGSNTSTNPEAELRQIQAYHQGTRGWCDIGYHFLISRDGRIWEGRPVERTAAHVLNNNTNNVGISLMGSFVDVPPSDAQLDSAARLVAALASEYGFPADNVRGHRDYMSTECPGKVAHGRIPEIVSRADDSDGTSAPSHCASNFGTAEPIPPEIRNQMIGRSWHENMGCPSLDSLTLLRMPYWGFDGAEHQGEMVVASSIADEVRQAFAKLHEARFPIERMELVHNYNGDDDASMAANNTSAFNCRRVTGGTALSKHSYGTAIDINPVQNPYVRGTTVLPPSGAAHVSRDGSEPGMIAAQGPAATAFNEIGWEWGGTWTSLKDYQHFESEGAPRPGCVSAPSTPGSVALRGLVFEAGKPQTAIEGATVRAGSTTVTTDAGGLYELSVEPGAHEIVASATGYVSSTIARTVGMSGEAVAWGSIGLSRESATAGTGVIQGIVHRGSNASDTVAGATVFVDGAHMTTSAENGLYRLDGLPPGTHQVTATADGDGSGTATSTTANGEVSWANISVSAGAVTPQPPSPQAPSCSGLCASSDPAPGGSTECYCDERCVLFSDCCPDREAVCASAPTGSCTDQCYSPFAVPFSGGECYCDSACSRFEDCCSDFEQLCLSAPPPSCEGLCGSATAVFGPDGPCFCDPVCLSGGDCCGDYEAVCQ